MRSPRTVLASRAAALVLSLGLAYASAGAKPALAQQSAASGTVTGTVVDADGAPVAAATVILESSTRQSKTSDAKGAFRFADVVPGAYSLVVSKGGFSTFRQDDIFAVAGSDVNLNVILAASSFSSLRVIGSVSTRVPGRASINKSTAAVNVVSNETFADQGQVQVTKVLNETPGIITNAGVIGQGQNGASQGTTQFPQIRGALPYETESLIDGHAVSVGASGFFSPTFLNPALLQNVELVKGPGSMPTEINYAINGTVNYRSLEPTRSPHEAIEFGVDGYGGLSTAFQATGSASKHVLDYAFAYATDGTPGPLRNYPVAGSQLPLAYGSPPWTLNGQPLAGPPIGIGPGPTTTAVFGGTVGQIQFQEPLYVCCAHVNSGFDSKAELMKVRLNLSQGTALTLSYLGGQGRFNLNGANMVALAPIGNTRESWSIFAPPAGYTGSVPAGTAILFDLNAEMAAYEYFAAQNLFQAEFRTTFGTSTTVLARYYTGASTSYQTQNGPSNGPFTFSGATWGGVPLCPVNTSVDGTTGLCDQPGGGSLAPTTTYFNGQQVAYSTNNVVNTVLDKDHLRGASVEVNRTVGRNDFAISFDRSHHDSSEYDDNPQAGFTGYSLPPSSSQQFTTVRLFGNLAVARHVTANVGEYLIQYASHYTGDGGVTWHDAAHSYNAPRLGLSWQPNADIAWRFSMGASIAPPFIALLSSPGSQPQPNILGAASAFLENINNGQISPETAFSYDLGIDKRIGRSTGLSADVYRTNLHNLFLPETFQQGTYTGPPGTVDAGKTLPLYISLTANLGVARYEGAELAIQRAPVTGLGYKLQGSLMRAYTYNLPAGFYDTAAGPYSTNLGITPTVNFQPSGLGYNSLEGGRVPYSMGYGELNYHTPAGGYYQLGLTYYGPNNGYNQPPFAVVSGAVRLPVGRNTTLQLSGDNLTGAYNSKWVNYFGGIPVSLANQGRATSGYLGAIAGLNVGPATFRLTLRHTFGQ